MVGRCVLNGTGRGSLLPSQEINSLPGGDNPEPTGQAAAPVSFELPELFEVIPDKGEKKILKQILNYVAARLRTIVAEYLFDRMVDKAGILKNKGIPGGFLSIKTGPKKILFLVGH